MGHEASLIMISGLMNTNENLAQYKAVIRGAGTGYYQVAGANSAIDGILQDDPQATGYVGSIGISGKSKFLVGAAGCTDGDELMTDATGALVTQTSTNLSVAKALGTYVSGDIGTCLLKIRSAH